MTKILADILSAKQPEFSHGIEKMELLAGKPGLDIKTTLRIKNDARRVIKKLGLDENDTSGHEFYQSLKHRLIEDNARITKMVSVGERDNPHQLTDKILSYINKRIEMPYVWQLKSGYVRKIIKKHPPKTLMKAMGYRSVDSLLKREQLAEIIALSKSVDPKWYEKVELAYNNAKPTEIEQKKVKIIPISNKRIQKINKKTRLKEGQILSVNELGSIVIVPPRERYKADVIANVVVLIEVLRELKLTSSLLKLITVKKDFGKHVSSLISEGSKYSEKILPISWSNVCNFAYKNRITPSFVQPHVTQEDLDIGPTVTDFCLTFPELNFWFGLESLALVDGDKVVSCNLVDNVMNTCNYLNFEDRTNTFARNSLKDELYASYLKHENIQNELLQFEDEGYA